MKTKSGETRRHSYLFMEPPDALAIVDFGATHDAAEVTVEMTQEGDELHILVKCGPDCSILLDECYDVSHDENRIDFSEDSGEDFATMLRDNEPPGATQNDYRQHFEHGQWWVVSTVSGETWSVVEVIKNGVPGVGFDLISEGADE